MEVFKDLFIGTGQVAESSEPLHFETELVARGKLKYCRLYNVFYLNPNCVSWM